MSTARTLGSSVSGLLLASALLFGGAACTEARRHPGGDSSGGGRGANAQDTFRAQLGRTWELARLGDQEITTTRPRSAARSPGMHPGPGTRPTIRFSTERAVMSRDTTALLAGGWSFCNAYGAAYTLGPDNQLRFHEFQSTLVGCYGPDSLETRYSRGLAQTRRFALDSTTLSLIADDGSRLTFVPAPDSAGPPF